jgi:NMD protein affecting ribosome stability and mRNA decay
MSNQEKNKYGCYKCGKEAFMTDGWGHNLCAACYIKSLITKKRRK